MEYYYSSYVIKLKQSNRVILANYLNNKLCKISAECLEIVDIIIDNHMELSEIADNFVCKEEEFLIGNIFDGLDTKRIKKLCEKFACGNKFCEKCANGKFCLYERCKLYNYSLTGDLYKPSDVGCMFEHFKLYMNKRYFEILSKGVID